MFLFLLSTDYKITIRDAVRLKESFRDMWSRGTAETVARYGKAQMVASAMTEAKQQVWEEFGEANEKTFWWAPKCFWKTGWHLRRGKRGIEKKSSYSDTTSIIKTSRPLTSWSFAQKRTRMNCMNKVKWQRPHCLKSSHICVSDVKCQNKTQLQ